MPKEFFSGILPNCSSLLPVREARVQREEVKDVRSYEMVTILKADVEDVNAVTESLAEIVRGLGAEEVKTDLWGKKKFAYLIEKEFEGYYVLFTFKLDPAQIKEMERLLSLKDQVIRHMVVNLEEK